MDDANSDGTPNYAVIKHDRGIHFRDGRRCRESRTLISVPLHAADIRWSQNESAVAVCSFRAAA